MSTPPETIPTRRRTKVRILALTAVAAAAAIGLTALPSANAEPEDVQAMQLVWSDEFDGPAGTAPDPAKWKYDIGGGGWGNNEHQYYTSSTDNAALDGGGNLAITAREGNPAGHQCWYGPCEYTSARLLTAETFTQQYGRFEARMQIPRGQGIWPAFWMLGDDIGQVGWPQSGEIDIMENIGSEPSTVHGTVHGPGYSGAGGIGNSYTLPGGEQFADGFHTFAVDWEPGSITWSVDGNVYSTLTPDDVGGNEWVFDHPFFMIMNVAVGGNWPGYPDGSTQFPQTLLVDYVRVYSGDGGGSTGGEITGLAGKCVDVRSSGTDDGTPVQLYHCNGTGAQQWTFESDGTVRALGKCLDVSGGGTADGTKVQLWTCNGTGAQQWVLSGANDLVNPQADKCLDVPESNSADGTQLQIWTCAGTENQKWYR
ncbi:RICIN domain-containing protein [Glycomyces salinus]|uniref:RICIN domain-containing protein n=1 Tax=Glycomyces salinus TaxID=980294 RepID=UPI0027DA83F5|nr:family 16 glycosylhydrolase [Glycomyces salinus]